MARGLRVKLDRAVRILNIQTGQDLKEHHDREATIVGLDSVRDTYLL